jgi:hypothetical protein
MLTSATQPEKCSQDALVLIRSFFIACGVLACWLAIACKKLSHVVICTLLI